MSIRHREKETARFDYKSGLALGATLGLAAFLLLVGPAAAGVDVKERDCNGVQAVIKVPPANVDPVVPDESDPSSPTHDPDDFELELDDQGKALLAVGAVHCLGVTVGDGIERDTTFAHVAVAIKKPHGSSGQDFHLYHLWIDTNNRQLVKFYRHEGGNSDRQAVYTENLSFNIDPLGRFTFRAPSAPYGFQMSADVDPPIVGPFNITGDFWAAVPTGTMEQGFPDTLFDFRFGGVRNGLLTPDRGSELERLMCGVSGEFHGDPAGVIIFPTVDPLGLVSNSLRSSFPRGVFSAGVHRDRKPSATDAPDCPS